MRKTKVFTIVSVWVITLMMTFILVTGCQGDKPPEPGNTAANTESTAQPTDGATTSVTVENTAPDPAATTAVAVTPSPTRVIDIRNFKRRTSRDPFVPPTDISGFTTTDHVATTPTPHATRTVATSSPVRTDTPKPTGSPTKTVIANLTGADVGMELTGVMKVGGSYQALITAKVESGGTRVYTVGPGAKLGQYYTVASVSEKQVILKAASATVKLDLNVDGPAAPSSGSGKGGQSTGTKPGSDGPPPPPSADKGPGR